ncbi:hypothetical protein AKJ38_01955 [candidate division MSBL1 archaeon SCGC-AAA259I14]|uniref:Uncharacterized protein n=1 Tax=candidate division MSBL1 archaeon SCGC-AAA259I14 TaxID=1698268 RepID=A0A133USG8_9EURY|nr:hypothetical protein AKJ38_01955 [candidate division MSBL1 archaeon SCGC-AAA259I14]
MDFDLDVIVEWMEEIGAEIVSIGPDSGGNELPEPTTEEVYQLLKELAEFTRVEPKKNLVERMSRELDDFQGLDTDEVYAELKDRGYLPDAVFE